MPRVLTAGLVMALALVPAVASAQRKPLTAEQLDRITAAGSDGSGQASGGAIVGNDSTATINSSGTVELTDGVQAGARALNLVNSSESTVANGVNIFDGRAETGATLGAGTYFDVAQRNEISQEQRRVASVPRYDRSGANIDSTFSDAGNSSLSSTLNSRTVETDVDSTTHSVSSDLVGGVDALSTLLGQQVQAGRGLAAAGELDVHFDGGDISFTAGGGVTIADAVTFEGDVSLTIGLPEFTVAIQGAGCAVMNGSCTFDGSFEELTESLRDLSTLHEIDKSVEQSREWDASGTKIVRAPFRVVDAQAEYIVLDDSEINVDTTYVVTLTGGAQAELRGLNVVNTAGSAVANGVNVAQQRTGSLEAGGSPLLGLSQSNVIVHSR